jgi:proteasome lid subunit RPN8/RPN11
MKEANSTEYRGRVVIPTDIMERIRRHGEETYPAECCGFMLGSADDGARRVVEILPQANERTDSPGNRFLISPTQFRDAERHARKAGRQLVGIYHSHPDSPARPSEFDRDHAWPWFSYLIVSVGSGKAGESNGWQLKDDRSAYDRLEVVIAKQGETS